MPEVLRAGGRIEEEDWTLIPYPASNTPKPKATGKAGLARNTGEAAAPPALLASLEIPESGRIIVPLALWQARRAGLQARFEAGEIALWLDACEEVETLIEAVDLAAVPLLALDFPKAGDGRAYSSAALLRGRFRYRGPLWAVGDVQRDYFAFMFRCGFDTLVPRAGRYTRAQLEEAAASLGLFAQPYQGAIDDPLPLWRRVQRSQAIHT
ncbi:MAG: DUF934 domain-containing protein [Candidatus Accumulibacter sp.]|jgi:uncharacterized protein (DUF934 family)|nr:DUF934 domain-containing protein [Accumulibacter sp.]